MKLLKTLLASVALTMGVLSTPVVAKDSPQLSDKTFKVVNKVQELIATEKYSMQSKG